MAWKSGFSSTAYFIKLFKSKVGVTPNTYRKERMYSLF
ncbi:MAG: helix-turn-helix transcriptional regulator [Ruminococcaceae bacterium]|nr:helix-turn-helix transcriptional regulator [Oscillospiraceae bacterium]